MDISAKGLKQLRLRLGWSLAEMARQMGCSVEIINSWESGHQAPEPEALNQFRYLYHYAETYNQNLAQTPHAERKMELMGLSQLTHRDFSESKK